MKADKLEVLIGVVTLVGFYIFLGWVGSWGEGAAGFCHPLWCN